MFGDIATKLRPFVLLNISTGNSPVLNNQTPPRELTHSISSYLQLLTSVTI